MTYLELYKDAERKLEKNEITIGEYEEMIAPLRVEIPKNTMKLSEVYKLLGADMRGDKK